jgi:hypothetical protein
MTLGLDINSSIARPGILHQAVAAPGQNLCGLVSTRHVLALQSRLHITTPIHK